MFTDSIAVNGSSITDVLQRRPVGKVGWRRVIDQIIASEKADIQDLATLRRRINDPELLKIIAELNERKSIRIIELTQLYHYRDSGGGSSHE